MPTVPSKPKLTRELAVKLAEEEWERSGPDLPMPTHYELFIRGYRATSMGPTDGNDVNVWDDLAAFVAPGYFRAVNANVDPTRYGWNAGAGKPMAVLNVGCWPFYRGAHKGKTPALRQFTAEEAKKYRLRNDGRFSVTRTYAKGDKRNYQEAGYYAINQHIGGNNTVSSEGCLTFPPEYARDYLQDVWDKTKDAKVNVIWTILIDGPVN